MEELYKKIFIKSEADLPKESGKYFYLNSCGLLNQNYGYRKFDKENTESYNFWLNNVDWYLLPIAEGEQEKAADNVKGEKSISASSIETPEFDSAVNKYIDEGINHDCLAIKKMEIEGMLNQFVFDTWFYAVKWERERYAQSRPEKDKKIIACVTDEKIESYAKVYDRSAHCGQFDGEDPGYHFKIGAKWALSQDVSLRDELINFACRNDKYNMDKIRTADEPAMLELYRKDHERSVDEYLKSRKDSK
jgi:hypothetical protein